MIKTLTLLLCMSFAVLQSAANIHHIDVSKISADKKLVAAFQYIKDNSSSYDHWKPAWTDSIPKEALVKTLRGYYKDFSSLAVKNEETYLLLGDIAHYLYNMDDTAYFNNAVLNYTKAAGERPKDYRAYWFPGYHYALSNNLSKAIEQFKKAQSLLPANEPADFWNDYAMTYALTNMPSHCIYAMDKVKSISGKEGSFQETLGETVYYRMVEVDNTLIYDKYDLWTVGDGKRIPFTSRPLGMKIMVDSTWNLSLYDYQNRQSAFVMEPPVVKSKKGKEIGYTIAVMMKSADANETLDDYTGKFVSKYPDKSKIIFSDKYERMLAYEIKDKHAYEDMGGAHIYMIGIERDEPQYPGMLLEDPESLPPGKTGETSYFSVSPCQKRFKGKIFYLIILDSCEDIHEETFAVFKTMLEKYIIIE